MKRLILAILIVAAIAWQLGLLRAAGPLEPPSQFRLPQAELKAAFPEMNPTQFAWLMEAWKLSLDQTYEGDKYIYERLRGTPNTLVQFGQVYLPLNDTAALIFASPFADTLYGVSVTRMLKWHDTTGVWTGTSKIRIGRIWPESCHVWAGTDNSGHVKYVAAGTKP